MWMCYYPKPLVSIGTCELFNGWTRGTNLTPGHAAQTALWASPLGYSLPTRFRAEMMDNARAVGSKAGGKC